MSQTYNTNPETVPQETKMTDRDPLINRGDGMEDGFFNGLLRPCVAELVGTMLFVFIGTMAAASGGLSLTVPALAHGFAIFLLVAGTARISGGHLNPAVTLGVFLSGSLPVLKAGMYIVAQLIGGLLGAALTRGCLTETRYKAVTGGANMLADDISAGQGMLCEIVLTTILVLTVLLTAVDDNTNTVLAPMCIGLSVAADIFAGGPVSGASMNPARSFGPAVVVSHFTSKQWDYHYIYWIGPAIGSFIAVIFFRLFLAGPEKRIIN